MKNLASFALRFHQDELLVLNQQKLPHQEEWLQCKSPHDMQVMIRHLQIRGAPLIGIAAALALAHYAETGATTKEIREAADLLKSARPTAINLSFCINKLMQAYELIPTPETLVEMAENLFQEDYALCEKIAMNGAPLIIPGDNILTHCNTGSLVTTGIGTALGMIRKAHENFVPLHVFVDETRPLLQGARLTTWELEKLKIPHTLICDNMAASLMQAGSIQKIIVGADRIAKNGDFANKIGTYNLAVLAKHHKIPFYVAAPYTTFDPHCANGNDIIVEERNPAEVRGYEQERWSPAQTPVFNPAFDVTPAELVSAFIFDKGIFNSRELFNKTSLVV